MSREVKNLSRQVKSTGNRCREDRLLETDGAWRAGAGGRDGRWSVPRMLIRVGGAVSADVRESLADRFPQLVVRVEEPATVLVGHVEAGEQLSETLARLSDLGVGVVEVVWAGR